MASVRIRHIGHSSLPTFLHRHPARTRTRHPIPFPIGLLSVASPVAPSVDQRRTLIAGVRLLRFSVDQLLAHPLRLPYVGSENWTHPITPFPDGLFRTLKPRSNLSDLLALLLRSRLASSPLGGRACFIPLQTSASSSRSLIAAAPRELQLDGPAIIGISPGSFSLSEVPFGTISPYEAFLHVFDLLIHLGRSCSVGHSLAAPHRQQTPSVTFPWTSRALVGSDNIQPFAHHRHPSSALRQHSSLCFSHLAETALT